MSRFRTAEGAVTSRVMRRLLPFLLLMYVLAFLDRANIGFAQKALQQDTGLTNAAFAFGAACSSSVMRFSRCRAICSCIAWARSCGCVASW